MPDGRYKFQYTESEGKRRAVYSWKLVENDSPRGAQRQQETLREKEKRILKDLDDHIKTQSAEQLTVNDMLEKFMNIRMDLRGTTRRYHKDIFGAPVCSEIGGKPIGRVKPSDIQKIYHKAVAEHGISSSTVQKVHSVVYQIFEIAVVDNIIRVNPPSSAFLLRISFGLPTLTYNPSLWRT